MDHYWVDRGWIVDVFLFEISMQPCYQDETTFEGLESIRKRMVSAILQPLSKAGTNRIIPVAQPLSCIEGTASIVRDGNVDVHLRGQLVYRLQQGDVIGPWLGSYHELTFNGHDRPAALIEVFEDEFQAFLNSSQSIQTLWTSYVGALAATFLGLLSQNIPHRSSPPRPRHHHFAAGDTLIRQGQMGDDVFALREGAAEVIVNGVKVGQIGPGQIFGALAAITGQPRCATVIAAQHGTLMSFRRSEFQELMKEQPEIMVKLVDDLAGTINSLNGKLVDMAGLIW